MAWASRMRGAPFAWGHTDCATLAIRGLELLTGRPFPEYRWSSEAQALAVAGRERPSQVLQEYGLQPVLPGFERAGDVILAPREPWPECCHLCLGRYSLSAEPGHRVGMLRTTALLALPGAVVLGLR